MEQGKSLPSSHTCGLGKNQSWALGFQSETTTLQLGTGAWWQSLVFCFPLLEWNLQHLSQLGWKKSWPPVLSACIWSSVSTLRVRAEDGRNLQSSWLCLPGSFCTTGFGDGRGEKCRQLPLPGGETIARVGAAERGSPTLLNIFTTPARTEHPG